MSGAVEVPRVAVFGAGYWGKNIVRNMAELGALVAVCDRDRALAASVAEANGSIARDVEEVLADDAIAAVAIAAPAAMHFELTTAALEAGKDVFVEKPLALVVDEAEKLCELAADRGRILMVGHLLQYHPAFLRLRELVRSGELGRLQYLYSTRLNLGRIRREEDILWSFAPHDISMILSLVGSEPESIQAVGSRYLHESIADVTTTHFGFASGVRAHVFVSWLHPFKEQRMIVVGDRGMAVFDDGQPWESKLVRYRHHVDWVDGLPQPVKADAEPVGLEPGEPLNIECAHFLECVTTRATPRTDGREGVRVLKVLDAAARSMRTVGDGPASKVPDRAPAWPDAMVHETAIVDDGASIGAGTKIWHFSHVLTGSTIGRDCNLGQNVVVGPNVSVGDGCRVQNNVSIYEGVELEDSVFCGPSCVFTNVINPRAEVSRKDEFKPTIVRRGATIGANATIVCGNEIGAYAFVAAGAVVTTDVVPHALVAGVPARRIGWMSRAGERLGDDLICPRSGQRYREVGDDRLEELT